MTETLHIEKATKTSRGENRDLTKVVSKWEVSKSSQGSNPGPLINNTKMIISENSAKKAREKTL